MREKINFAPDYGKKADTSIIKVIGVGGGGGNAVQHMYQEGIEGVNFLICNTDRGALENNLVPSQLVLGESGLGAGANPEKARELALATKEKLIDFIGKETKMLFITAGMGKGTGTGASPVVAEIAKEMGILTIAVVTYPFKFEQCNKVADKGIEELRKHVDSLIVVRNQNIIKFYNDEDLDTAFGYADDVLKNAVKCIAELITKNTDQNVDFNDVCTIMRNSGEAMLGLATASGENRVDEVFKNALSCPLLQEDRITNAKSMLFFVSYNKILISEFERLTEQLEALQNQDSKVIWGRGQDESLGDNIKLSVIVTRFNETEKAQTNTETKGGINWGDVLGTNNGGQVIDITDINNKPAEPKQDDDPLKGLFDKAQVQQPTMQQVQPQPTMTQAQPISRPTMQTTSDKQPQLVRDTNDPRFEDDFTFNELVSVPAYTRNQANGNQASGTSAMVEQRSTNNIEVEDDLHDFFKFNPD